METIFTTSSRAAYQNLSPIRQAYTRHDYHHVRDWSRKTNPYGDSYNDADTSRFETQADRSLRPYPREAYNIPGTNLQSLQTTSDLPLSWYVEESANNDNSIEDEQRFSSTNKVMYQCPPVATNVETAIANENMRRCPPTWIDSGFTLFADPENFEESRKMNATLSEARRSYAGPNVIYPKEILPQKNESTVPLPGSIQYRSSTYSEHELPSPLPIPPLVDPLPASMSSATYVAPSLGVIKATVLERGRARVRKLLAVAGQNFEYGNDSREYSTTSGDTFREPGPLKPFDEHSARRKSQLPLSPAKKFVFDGREYRPYSADEIHPAPFSDQSLDFSVRSDPGGRTMTKSKQQHGWASGSSPPSPITAMYLGIPRRYTINNNNININPSPPPPHRRITSPALSIQLPHTGLVALPKSPNQPLSLLYVGNVAQSPPPMAAGRQSLSQPQGPHAKPPSHPAMTNAVIPPPASLNSLADPSSPIGKGGNTTNRSPVRPVRAWR